MEYLLPGKRLISRWGDRAVADIGKVDISALLVEKQKSPATARNLLFLVRSIFAWALEMQDTDLPEF